MVQTPDLEAEDRIFRRLLNLVIRVALIITLVWWCYAIFAPFVSVMLWALILAINMFPLHQRLAHKLGGRQGLSATLLVMVGTAIFVVPTAILMNILGDNLSGFIEGARDNSLSIPAPSPSVADWPIIGDKIYPTWKMAATDLPALIQSLQPKIGDVTRQAVSMVASLGGSVMKFFFSYLISGILMANGQAGYESARAISRRMVGSQRGEDFLTLCTATIRAVARGVIGIAFVQALLLGLALAIAGVPAPGILAVITLVLGIAQAPAALVSLPAIAYIWMAGGHSTAMAIAYTLLLLAAGSADNILKPLLLGRGVDAPMPVILLGALGGMVSAGILGLFVGSTALTLGYQIFMDWVADDAPQPTAEPA